MKSKSKKRKLARRKTKLGLPDLDHAKAAVLASLRSPESQRSYRHAIDEFVGWYCSEPRLSFNKTVVTRYRIHLEDRRLASGTTNVRLAAVRRLSDEAADAGLLSPELAAGIRRVKGSKRLGVRLGNWLTAEQARSLWQLPSAGTLKSKRDRAILAVLLGCGLRRRELSDLTLDHLQCREEHWAIIDLIGKGASHSDRPCSRLGEANNRRLAYRSRRHERQTVPARLPIRHSLGRGNNRKSGLACREGVRREDWSFETRTT
jgi:site-specific recombinase XerC